MKNLIILSAGKSKRMQSEKIKVLHDVFNKPIIKRITDNLKPLGFNKTIIVVGEKYEEIKACLGEDFIYAVQEKPLGTANAVSSAVEFLQNQTQGETVIVMGDGPLISASTIENLIDKNKNYDFTLLTAIVNEPNSYGKIVKDKNLIPMKVVEHSSATPSQKLIKEINTGVCCIKTEKLIKFLPYINNNNVSNEYRFFDILELLYLNKGKVQSIIAPNAHEFDGINTRLELHNVTKRLQNDVNVQLLNNGVTLIDINSIFVAPEVIVEQDVTIYPNNYIYGNSVIKSGTIIYPNSYIENSIIGENCIIKNSTITNSIVESNSTIGPYSHIRQNSHIGPSCRVGNFTEVKNTTFGEHVKAAHLSYLGDSEIESNVNIGCGVVTANYNGVSKEKTKIETGAFVGCNTNLIAPITVGKGAIVAAGSTVSKDVPENSLTIERAEVVVKENYATTYYDKLKERKNKK